MTFFVGRGDQRMAAHNQPAWDAIADRVLESRKYLPESSWTVVDWGGGEGGLLRTMAKRTFSCFDLLIGVDPDNEARRKALEKMPETGLDEKSYLFLKTLEEVGSQSVDVFLSHETLYLVKLRWFFPELKRVLKPGGAAFVALGSHSENEAWIQRRQVIDKTHGIHSYVHAPMDIVETGHAAGFKSGFRRLWPAGYPDTNWYSPAEVDWAGWRSAEELLKFRDSKFLFEFWPR